MSKYNVEAMPTVFKDPLTLQPFCDPVVLIQTGQSFERYVLEAHLSVHRTCPITHDILDERRPLYVPNVALRNAVDQWFTSNSSVNDDNGPMRPSHTKCWEIDPARLTMRDWIGSGGGGEVWAADLSFASGHKVRVAVKTPDVAGGLAAEERLAQELKHLGRATDRRCNNVVRLIGESKFDGRRCAVIARYDCNLADAADVWAAAPSSVPLRRRLGYALDIVRGVVALHSAGLCHLDLCPENVLLHRATDALFVADLDLATELLGKSDEGSRTGTARGLTQESKPVGHPSFISPEGWQVSVALHAACRCSSRRIHSDSACEPRLV